MEDLRSNNTNNESMNNVVTVEEALWDKIVVGVAVMLIAMGFTLPVLAQLP